MLRYGRLSSDLALERIFRSVIKRQTKVDYVFLGSKTHTLKRMFTDAARPFYESAAVLCMGKPPEDESVAFLMFRFASAGVECPEPVAQSIMAEANNVPYYLQALGAEAFDRGILECERGIYRVADPFFAAYLREKAIRVLD